MADILSLPDAERLAEQLLNEAIPARSADEGWEQTWEDIAPPMIERVSSDLDGLRESLRWYDVGHGNHARRYSNGLRATAALYGVT